MRNPWTRPFRFFPLPQRGRGFGEGGMARVAEMIDRVLAAGLKGEGDLASEAGKVRKEVRTLCGAFALPGHG